MDLLSFSRALWSPGFVEESEITVEQVFDRVEQV